MKKFKIGNSVKTKIKDVALSKDDNYIGIKGKYVGMNDFGTARVLGISSINSKEIKLYNIQPHYMHYMSSTRLDKNLSLAIDNKIKEYKNKKYMTLDDLEDFISSKNLNNIVLNKKESIGVFRQPMYLSISIYKDGEPYEEFKGATRDYEYDGTASICYNSGEDIIKNNWNKVNNINLNKLKILGVTDVEYNVYYRGEDTQCLRVSYKVYNKENKYYSGNILEIVKYLNKVLTS